MSTLPIPPKAVPPPLTLPLTPEQRSAYQNLYDQYESAIEASADPGILEALNASQTDVDNILTKDGLYRLHANTQIYEALLQQITSTNLDLKALQAQILAITGHISTFGGILAAISKVLTIIPGA